MNVFLSFLTHTHTHTPSPPPPPPPPADETVTYQSLSDDNLQSLSTLAYSDNVDLQRSAALCFSEISERREGGEELASVLL